MEQPGSPASPQPPQGKLNPAVIVGIIVVVLAGWYFLSKPSTAPANVNETASPTPSEAMVKKDVLTTIDTAASEIAFDFTSKFHSGSGRFAKFTAVGEFDRRDWTKLKAELLVDTASIETGIGVRDTHLKSADFFDAQQYPTLVYKVTKAELDEKKLQFNVTGDLTIRGKTLPVSAPVSVLENPDGSVTLKGSLVINRRQWGDFKYDGSKPINPVDDQIPIHITLVFR